MLIIAPRQSQALCRRRKVVVLHTAVLCHLVPCETVHRDLCATVRRVLCVTDHQGLCATVLEVLLGQCAAHHLRGSIAVLLARDRKARQDHQDLVVSLSVWARLLGSSVLEGLADHHIWEDLVDPHLHTWEGLHLSTWEARVGRQWADQEARHRIWEVREGHRLTWADRLARAVILEALPRAVEECRLLVLADRQVQDEVILLKARQVSSWAALRRLIWVAPEAHHTWEDLRRRTWVVRRRDTGRHRQVCRCADRLLQVKAASNRLRRHRRPSGFDRSIPLQSLSKLGTMRSGGILASCVTSTLARVQLLAFRIGLHTPSFASWIPRTLLFVSLPPLVFSFSLFL